MLQNLLPFDLVKPIIKLVIYKIIIIILLLKQGIFIQGIIAFIFPYNLTMLIKLVDFALLNRRTFSLIIMLVEE